MSNICRSNRVKRTLTSECLSGINAWGRVSEGVVPTHPKEQVNGFNFH